jgi:predicted DNA-binding protein (UPF0251 family)
LPAIINVSKAGKSASIKFLFANLIASEDFDASECFYFGFDLWHIFEIILLENFQIVKVLLLMDSLIILHFFECHYYIRNREIIKQLTIIACLALIKLDVLFQLVGVLKMCIVGFPKAENPFPLVPFDEIDFDLVDGETESAQSLHFRDGEEDGVELLLLPPDEIAEMAAVPANQEDCFLNLPIRFTRPNSRVEHRLQRAVNRLQKSERKAVTFVFFRGMSVAEAASTMKMRPGKFNNILDSALARLKEELEPLLAS